MKDLIIDQFQNSVEENLIRHVSLLDIITKFSEASSKVNRAVAKSITTCGCLQLSNCSKDLPEDAVYDQLKEHSHTELSGELCPVCREKIESEIGNLMFYLAAMCNKADVNMYDVFLKEYDRIQTLGKYNLY